jgi:DNA transformation protein and related proteins
MAKSPDPLAEYIVDQLHGWAPVTARRFFSGWGICRGPVILGIIIRDQIYFRTDETNSAEYETRGMAPFGYSRPDGKVTVMAYHTVPPEILDDTDELPRWAEKAFLAARKVLLAKHATKARRAAAKPKLPAKSKKAKAAKAKPARKPAKERSGK